MSRDNDKIVRMKQARQEKREQDPFSPAGGAAGRYRDDVGPVFIASFTSECAVCDGAIFEGDEARMVDGEAVHNQEECLP